MPKVRRVNAKSKLNALSTKVTEELSVGCKDSVIVKLSRFGSSYRDHSVARVFVDNIFKSHALHLFSLMPMFITINCSLQFVP
jgi:hypothetical protein